jgi:tetratricopeptide (TPR) repeat protein
MSETSGYLYILVNPGAKGLVKIGKTARDPEERAKELSSATGVPTPFIVVYSAFFDDCISAEVYVHTLLNDKRLSNNKEFFRITTTEAINAIIQAEGRFNNQSIKPDEINISKEESDHLQNKATSHEEICSDILEAAFNTLNGTDPEILQDEAEAIRLYKKAANLGCIKAYYQLGDLFYNKYVYDERKNDLDLALIYYQEGANHNNVGCWSGMAVCYERLKNYSNSDKCWVKLFTNPSTKDIPSADLGLYIYQFVNYMDNSRNYKHEASLEATYQELKKKGL